jgi:rhodanese-related sulfurtransferase
VPSVVTGSHLDPAAFAALTTEPGTVLLDVRTPQEYAEGHLPGALNLDVRGSGFAARLASLDRGALYAVYCHSGSRSALALRQMAASGFTRVVDLAGGITAWSPGGRQVVTGS